MTRPIPTSLGGTEAWQLRLAFIGKDLDARMAAMRNIWGNAQSPLDRVAAQVLLSRAARRVAPDADLQSDAPDLVASLLAGGFDREAARWSRVLGDMDDEPADKVWAMLALGAPDAGAARDQCDADRGFCRSRPERGQAAHGAAGRRTGGPWPDRRRSSPAGSTAHIGSGSAAETGWTRLIDGAMRRRQAGTVAAA